MKKLLLLLFLTVSCSKEKVEVDQYAACRPQIDALDNSKADVKTGLIEFDIIPDIQTKGAVLTSTKRLWENATIPYYFQPSTTHSGGGIILGFDREEDKNSIRKVIQDLERQTGLKIPEYESREDLLKEHKDGVEIASGNTTGQIRTNITPDVNIAGTTYAGKMDEIKYYKRALTPEEILSIYNSEL